MRKTILMCAMAMAMTLASATVVAAGNDKANCADLLGGVHGSHVVGDYVLGLDHEQDPPCYGHRR